MHFFAFRDHRHRARLRGGLRSLGDFYSSMDEIMCLPSSQAGLSLPRQRKMIEEELDRSLQLVDLCSAMQENLAELKMSTKDLQLVLKRGDDASLQLKVDSFARLAKKVRKHFKKITSTKACTSQGCRLVRLLAEAREMVLESTLHMLPKQFAIATTKASRSSLVSKRFQRRTAVTECEEVQLLALERAIGDLENGAELLFKRLIQSRVSLLNILSS